MGCWDNRNCLISRKDAKENVKSKIRLRESFNKSKEYSKRWRYLIEKNNAKVINLITKMQKSSKAKI
ncbi:MAG: hypothetical protein Tsb0014_15670 [Pleurocapsa sp.]